MGLYKKFEKLVESRKNIGLFILVLMLIVFRIPFEKFLANIFVNNLLSEFQKEIYLDIIFLLFIILINIYYIARIRRNYIPSVFSFIIILIFTGIYLFYRIKQYPWSFTPTYSISEIYYLDIILVFSFFNLLLLIQSKIQNRKAPNITHFIEDSPLSDENQDDLLEYKPVAENLMNKLIVSNFINSFSVGITGVWGSGKSTFLYYMQNFARNKTDIIEICFNPWKSDCETSITKDFFDQFQKKISYYIECVSIINYYSEKLINTQDKTYFSFAKTILGSERNRELNDLYQEIDDQIKKINKKIIVYIDDIDRLQKNEIIEVLKLIRNSANFSNTIFIAAYDKDYLISTISEQNEKIHTYLDKIFQIELNLPVINYINIQNYLSKELQRKLPEEFRGKIIMATIGNEISKPKYLIDWIITLRDAKRFVNGFCFNIDQIVNDVDFYDFFRLELLRFKFPQITKLLINDNNSLFSQEFNFHFKTNQIVLKIKEREQSDSKAEKITCLEEILQENKANLFLSKKDIEIIADLLKGVFSKSDSFSLFGYERSHLSVIIPSNFRIYFRYSLPSEYISEVDFRKARKSSQEDFNGKISFWVDQKLERKIKERFLFINKFDSSEDFEKIIKGIFFLANLKSQLSKNNANESIVDYDQDDLYSKMLIVEKGVLETIYTESEPEKSAHDFVFNLFKNAKSPYLFESAFLLYIKEHHHSRFPISKEEVNRLSFEYFAKYCDNAKEMDVNIWKLYHNSKVYYDSSEKKICPIITKKMQKFIEKDPVGFIKDIIKKESNGSYYLSGTVEEIYGSVDYFSGYLIKGNFYSDQKIPEFIRFLNQYSENESFQRPKKFKFEYLFS